MGYCSDTAKVSLKPYSLTQSYSEHLAWEVVSESNNWIMCSSMQRYLHIRQKDKAVMSERMACPGNQQLVFLCNIWYRIYHSFASNCCATILCPSPFVLSNIAIDIMLLWCFRYNLLFPTGVDIYTYVTSPCITYCRWYMYIFYTVVTFTSSPYCCWFIYMLNCSPCFVRHKNILTLCLL